MANQEETPIIGIIMGSESDMPAMEPCMAQLDAFGVPYEVKVASAHRKPAEVHEWATSARERGIRVIIAAAGKSLTPAQTPIRMPASATFPTATTAGMHKSFLKKELKGFSK